MNYVIENDKEIPEQAETVEDEVTANDEVTEQESSAETDNENRYFDMEPDTENFISSGSMMLDQILGGGWALGRISNVYGMNSSGKSLIAIEACTNMLIQHEGEVHYVEPEAAFDEDYAEALGCPVDRIEFPDHNDVEIDTVEQFYDYIADVLKKREDDNRKDHPLLIVLDSLDSLSDQAEMERGISDSTYGAGKARKLSEIFRRLNKRLKRHNAHLMVVSQVRENIGAAFGEKWTRSGGKALDFYASQIMQLKPKGKVEQTIQGVKRPVAVEVEAVMKKNKVGMPHRSAQFKIYFEFGIDELASNLEFLRVTKSLDRLGISESESKKIEGNPLKLKEDRYNELLEQSNKLVKELYPQIEDQFRPKRKKYSR